MFICKFVLNFNNGLLIKILVMKFKYSKENDFFVSGIGIFGK